MKVKEITYEEISKLLAYDPTSKTGLRWLVDRGGGAKAGQEAGRLNFRKGSIPVAWQVTINQKLYYAHRILYLLNHRQITATLQIDHIDGNPLNNLIENLRLVSNTVNNRNHRKQKNNTSGVTGVSYDTTNNLYVAHYMDSNEKIIRKSFSCKKLGNTQAFESACKWRDENFRELNNILGDMCYSNRHGKLN